MLKWFKAMSGLKINFEKSEVIPVGEVDLLEELACEIGCKVGKLPSSYLGLPLGASYKSVIVWKNVFKGGFRYGRDTTFQKGEDLLYFGTLLSVCQSILCPFLLSLDWGN